MADARDIFTTYDGGLPDPATVDIDFDVLAREVKRRFVPRLNSAGYTVEEFTWRDRERAWPNHIVEGRGNAVDPDSLGLKVTREGTGGNVGGQIVLYWGGWADVEAFDLSGGTLVEGLAVFTNETEALAACDQFTERLERIAQEVERRGDG